MQHKCKCVREANNLGTADKEAFVSIHLSFIITATIKLLTKSVFFFVNKTATKQQQKTIKLIVS